jgi:hypothetical protein
MGGQPLTNSEHREAEGLVSLADLLVSVAPPRRANQLQRQITPAQIHARAVLSEHPGYPPSLTNSHSVIRIGCTRRRSARHVSSNQWG